MPKIIGGSLQEHRRQTRRRLFDALGTLMAERGFDAITFSDIAATAGVGRTAVYNHFPDKEALLLGFVTHETEQYVARLEDALAEVDDPVEQLRTYVRMQVTLRPAYHLPGPDVRSVLSPAAAARMREHAALVEQVLRRILVAGMTAGAFAPQDVAATVPLVNACLVGRGLPTAEGPDRDHAIEATVQFVLRAVGASWTPGPHRSDGSDAIACAAG